MRNDIAPEISRLMLSINEELQASVGKVRATQTAEDSQRYISAVSTILSCILIDVLNPLYREHPDLIPDLPGQPNPWSSFLPKSD